MLRIGKVLWAIPLIPAIMYLVRDSLGISDQTIVHLFISSLALYLGIVFTASDGYAPRWERMGVPAEVRQVFSDMMGKFYLLDVIIWPIGALLKLDSNLLLMIHIMGLVSASVLGIIPVLMRDKK